MAASCADRCGLPCCSAIGLVAAPPACDMGVAPGGVGDCLLCKEGRVARQVRVALLLCHRFRRGTARMRHGGGPGQSGGSPLL